MTAPKSFSAPARSTHLLLSKTVQDLITVRKYATPADQEGQEADPRSSEEVPDTSVQDPDYDGEGEEEEGYYLDEYDTDADTATPAQSLPGSVFPPEKVASARERYGETYVQILSEAISPSQYSQELYDKTPESRIDDLFGEIIHVLTIVTDKDEIENYRLSGFGQMSELNWAFLADMTVTLGLTNRLRNFLADLIDRQQFHNIIDILKGFVKIYAEQQGHVYGLLTTAKPLSPEQFERAKEQFQLFLPLGSRLALGKAVDPSIQGGWRVELPGAVIDNTEKTEWKNFVDNYLTNLKASFAQKTPQYTPQQQAINAELTSVFGDNVPPFLKNL